ncbi:MAG: hypothetical protein WAM11_06710 [Cyanobium sp.]
MVLLLGLGLVGVLMSRLLGGTPVGQPQKPPAPAPTAINQVQGAVDAATIADRQRLNHALKALDPDARP